MNGYESRPEELLDKGKRIKTLFETYTEDKNKAKRVSAKVQSVWVGTDADSYITQINSYDKDFENCGQTIDKIADIASKHGIRLIEQRDTFKSAATKL